MGHVSESFPLDEIQKSIETNGLYVMIIDVFEFGYESSPGGDDSLSKHRNLLIFRELCSALGCSLARLCAIDRA